MRGVDQDSYVLGTAVPEQVGSLGIHRLRALRRPEEGIAGPTIVYAQLILSHEHLKMALPHWSLRPARYYASLSTNGKLFKNSSSLSRCFSDGCPLPVSHRPSVLGSMPRRLANSF